MSRPELPSGVRRVEERLAPGPVPLHVHEEWVDSFDWLVQGTTGRGEERFDLGLFGKGPVGPAMERWRALREATGVRRAVHGLQVHGREVRQHDDAAPGLLVVEGVDAHLTERPGILLTVSVADCVPISLVDPERRRIALLHGGWRGTAAGIVAAGLEAIGSEPGGLYAHLGPAICGRCYEVGPEVHEALGQPVPETHTPIDVRAVQAHQLLAAGVREDRVTVSRHCTRCGTGFFSHRAGSAGRQVGVLAIR